MNGVETARGAMSVAHLIYIPLCIFVGLFFGWILGGRASREEMAQLRHLLKIEEGRETAERLASLKKN
jgi:hypothetical protein